jgi:tetratricopeptide (TPR) repeat protein
MIGTVVGGRFRLEREAGSGGMGTVYRAHDLLDGGAVALKLLDSEEVRDAERFGQEAVILARMSHPAIVRYIAHGSAGGQKFIAMEWLEGVDLDTFIDREPLSLRQGLAVLRRTAEALVYAHGEGVIHRDLKPHNLFLPKGDIQSLKLLDFGIARWNRLARRLTQTGVLLGTPGYLAPETISGAREIDGRADLFSLGCLIYRCLAGRPPFEANDPAALLAQIILYNPPPLGELVIGMPPAIDDLVKRLLAKDPDRRPADARAVLAALQAFDELPDAPATYRRRRTDVSLTLTERRLMAVVLVGPPAPGTPATLPEGFEAHVHQSFGATLQMADPDDGTVRIVLPATGKSTDLAVRAARAALGVRALVPDRPLFVACGQVPVGYHGPGIDNLCEAGLRTLAITPPGRIVLQDIVVALIEGRFDLSTEGPLRFLVGEKAAIETRRRLLGKSTEFVGRGRELASLVGMMTACVDEGSAQAALVVGAAGIGKSRLLHEFLDQLRKQNPAVKTLFGSGDAIAAGSAFGILAGLLRRYADVRDGEPPEQSRRKFAACLGARLPLAEADRVVAFLGEIAHVTFPDSHHESLRTARANPQLMGDLIRRAFEDWLNAESETQPMLFVLEDLHWGDAGTMGLFDAVLRNLRERSVMVLALARPEVRQVFPDLWAGRGLQMLELGPLPRKLAERLVREALGAESSATLVNQLVLRADGNPFFLEELIRAARDGRTQSLPDSILGMVQARLDLEGDQAKRVLRAASVFGERFSRLGLAALLGGEAELPDLNGWIERLIDREIIRIGSAPAGSEGELAFCHGLLREAAYAALTEEDVVLGHRLAGDHLEQAGCPDRMILAEHFRLGHEPLRSARWYREAAEQALRASDLAGAIARAELGLAAVAAVAPEQHDQLAPDMTGALRLTQAEAHLWRGELVEAERRGLEAAGAMARGQGLWYRALSQTIISVAKQGKVEDLVLWVILARTEPRSSDATDAVAPNDAIAAQVLCLAWAASFLLVAAHQREADDIIRWTTKQLAQLPDPDPQAQALLHQARAAQASLAADPAACLAALESAQAAFERAGDTRNTAAVRANIGFMLGEFGAWERAEQVLREALADADRLGLVELRAVVQHNLGRALAYRGDLAEGERLERVALECFAAQGEPRLEGLARIYLAEIKLLSGIPAEAQSQATCALDLLVSAPAHQVQARAVLARALLALGLVGPALEAAERAAHELELLGTIDEGEADVRLVHAECLAATGQHAEARKVAERACARLSDRSARIADGDLRARFMADVPAHVRTVDLREKLTAAGGA